MAATAAAMRDSGEVEAEFRLPLEFLDEELVVPQENAIPQATAAAGLDLFLLAEGRRNQAIKTAGAMALSTQASLCGGLGSLNSAFNSAHSLPDANDELAGEGMRWEILCDATDRFLRLRLGDGVGGGAKSAVPKGPRSSPSVSTDEAHRHLQALQFHRLRLQQQLLKQRRDEISALATAVYLRQQQAKAAAETYSIFTPFDSPARSAALRSSIAPPPHQPRFLRSRPPYASDLRSPLLAARCTAKRVSVGTGVFIPRRVVSPQRDPNHKPTSQKFAHLPSTAGAVAGTAHCPVGCEAKFPGATTTHRNPSAGVPLRPSSSSPEMNLPSEWTY